jgi:hypothetical protein
MHKITYLALGLSLGVFFMTLAGAHQELTEYRTAQDVQVPTVTIKAIGVR